jgi:hypothetical protein
LKTDKQNTERRVSLLLRLEYLHITADYSDTTTEIGRERRVFVDLLEEHDLLHLRKLKEGEREPTIGIMHDRNDR